MKHGKMAFQVRSFFGKTAICGMFIGASAAYSPAATASWNVSNPPNNGWSITSNWAGSITPGGNDVVFGDLGAIASSGTTTNTVDGIYTINSLSYSGTSSLFDVTTIGSGAALTVQSNVSTTGALKSVINLNGGSLDLSGNALGVTTFNATSGTLRNLGQFNAGATLVKTGTGSLAMEGLSAYTGTTSVQGGTLVVSGSLAATTAVALSAASRMQINLANNSTGAVNAASTLTLTGGSLAVNVLSGAAAQTLGNMTLTGTGLGNTIQVSASGTLTLGNTWTRASNSSNTLHLDLSSGGTILSVPSGTITNGVIGAGGSYVTVTDATGSTGFAATGTGVDTGKIVRFVPANVLSGATASNTLAHYRTSGNITMNSGSNRGIGDLTINTESGPGSLNLNGIDMSFRNKAIVMSGTSNFTISNGSLQNAVTDRDNEFIIHQYSTGTLTISANLTTAASANTVNALTKTGPGAVVFSGTGKNAAFYNQEGLFVLNGALLSGTRQNVISKGATLAGSGTLGNAATSSTMFEGDAVFKAENMTMNGSLQMQAGADFSMALNGANATGVTVTGSSVSIAGADLVLSLNYAAVFGDSYTLLNNTGANSVIGTFATINGASFGAGNTFSLSYLGNTYSYQVFYNDPTYGANDVILRVVPEPSTVALAGTAAIFLLLLRRRRRSKS